MFFDMNPEDIHNNPSYNALIEYAMRACPTDPDDRNVTPLCDYLTGRISSANWMIQEQENGDMIIKFIEDGLRFEGEPELRKEAEKQYPSFKE
jgi:hypothetical protein